MKKLIKTRVWTIICPQCKVELYSRARHDFRHCGCSFGTFVDGGFSGYIRYGGKNLEALRNSFHYRYVNATKRELYDDWNERKNKYGVINK